MQFDFGCLTCVCGLVMAKNSEVGAVRVSSVVVRYKDIDSKDWIGVDRGRTIPIPNACTIRFETCVFARLIQVRPQPVAYYALVPISSSQLTCNQFNTAHILCGAYKICAQHDLGAGPPTVLVRRKNHDALRTHRPPTPEPALGDTGHRRLLPRPCLQPAPVCPLRPRHRQHPSPLPHPGAPRPRPLVARPRPGGGRLADPRPRLRARRGAVRHQQHPRVPHLPRGGAGCAARWRRARRQRRHRGGCRLPELVGNSRGPGRAPLPSPRPAGAGGRGPSQVGGGGRRGSS
jgi:hypothetical protein